LKEARWHIFLDGMLSINGMLVQHSLLSSILPGWCKKKGQTKYSFGEENISVREKSPVHEHNTMTCMLEPGQQSWNYILVSHEQIAMLQALCKLKLLSLLKSIK